MNTTDGSNLSFAGISTAPSVMTPANARQFSQALQGALARFIADEWAVNTVGGTGDAITVTATQGWAAYATGQGLRFVAGATNTTTSVTLNVNSIGAKAVRKISGGVDVALAVGDLVQGETYTLIYRASANSSAGAWVVVGLSVPVAQATTSAYGTTKLATLAQTLAQSPAGLVPTIENLFFPTGHLFGCTISNNSGTPASKLDVAAGTARDSTDSYDLQLTSAITAKDLTSAWAVGSSAGLLDTGAVGNNTYHIYLIKRTDTGVVDVIASLSASAPTLPTNYTLYRRIGSILREGGSIVSFTQVGDKFVRNTPIQDVSATNPGTSAVTRTLSVPTGIKVEAIVTASMRDAAAGAAVINVYLSDLSQADVAASATNATVASGGSSSNSNGSATARIMTNTSAQIRSRLDTSGASQTLTIGTHGWVDTRGRI